MTVNLRAERVIDAPVEQVWAVLGDLPGWNSWNPTLFDVQGPAVVGSTVKMKLRLGPFKVPMRQEIRVYDPPRELAWRSKQTLPAKLFDVLRTFRLEPMDDGRTRLVHLEEGTGVLAGLIFALIGSGVRKGYGEMSRTLAERLKRSA